ncbi:MAG: leucyl aminopeptidase [Calditrichaeota bacterium]|nr:leucyl aminopeptidase [Calditrichota bacterium]
MFQIATVPEHGLNTNLLVLFLSESFIKKRKKDFRPFPPCVIKSLENYFHAFKDFKGELKETLLLYPTEFAGVRRILFVGIGDEDKLTAQEFRELGYLIQKYQEKLSTRRNHIYLGNLKVCHQDIIENLTEGIYFKRYVFNRYKKDEKKKPENNARYIFVCGKEEYSPRYRHAFLKTRKIMKGVYLARDLANQPSNFATPEDIKNFVETHFSRYNNCSVEIFDQKALEKLNMNALLGVAKGSEKAPYLVIIKYSPASSVKKRIALVGKGVTFDSGGISIKPSANMEEMKYDMSGAAAVIGSMDFIANMRPKAEVYGILPLAENMPGGRALKPGDIVKTYSGKTVEVINTDAEGRLILADALSLAIDRFKPGVVVDFATLTGSCLVALGDKRAGLFSNSSELRHVLFEAGETSGDFVWPMPLDDIYKKDLESQIADIKNIGGRGGGAITAAKFLEAFVNETTWAHIDMAGTAYNIKHIEYWGKGAAGFGPRLIASALRGLIKLA